MPLKSHKGSIKMQEKLNYTDLRILEGLGIYGSRNVTGVARNLGFPPETVRKRLKRLSSQLFLRFNINIYHTNLGLKKAVILAEAIPGYEQLLFDSVRANDFWIAVARCYGMFEGCVGVYTIPKDHCAEFEQFLDEVKNLGAARSVQVFWSTCFQTVHSRCNWFDPKSEAWNFDWDKWIEEIPTEGTTLPYTLVDPDDFPIRGDQMDVLILKELEKDATISFTDLARILGVSPQLLRYHYQNHVIERGLMEGFEVTAFHFGRDVSDFLFFIFKFDDKEKLAKFASSLMDKPFAKGLGKILGENALFGYIYLPRSEVRRFIDVLSKLVRSNFVESYRYAIQDLKASLRQTISYEYFRNKSWIYDHKKHIQNLRDLVESAKRKSRTSEITFTYT